MENIEAKLEAALAPLLTAQERSKILLEEAEGEQKKLEEALANRKEGESLQIGGILPARTVKLLIQRMVVQLRGEFIAALEAIKG